ASHPRGREASTPVRWWLCSPTSRLCHSVRNNEWCRWVGRLPREPRLVAAPARCRAQQQPVPYVSSESATRPSVIFPRESVFSSWDPPAQDPTSRSEFLSTTARPCANNRSTNFL